MVAVRVLANTGEDGRQNTNCLKETLSQLCVRASEPRRAPEQ